MESVQDWLERKRQRTRRPIELQTIEALALLLEGKNSPLETAKIITAIYEPSLKVESEDQRYLHDYKPRDHNVQYLGITICDAISSFGSAEARDRLASLIVEISTQPDVLHSSGSKIEIYHGDQVEVYWSSLPSWTESFDSYVIYTLHNYLDLEEDVSLGYDERYLVGALKRLNAIRFAAPQLAKGRMIGLLDVRAGCQLVDALEPPGRGDSPHPAGHHIYISLVLVPTAAMWLLIAGKKIYDLCMNNGYIRKRNCDYSLEQWALWKEKLTKYTERDDFGEDCRELAAGALEKMIEIEEGNQTI